MATTVRRRTATDQRRVRAITTLRPALFAGYLLDGEALHGLCPAADITDVRVDLRGCHDWTTAGAHVLAAWASAGWRVQLEGDQPIIGQLTETVERMTRQLLDVEAQFVEAG